MLGPIKLNRLMRRHAPAAMAVLAVLAIITALAIAKAGAMVGHDQHHAGGHGKSAAVLCVAVGGCIVGLTTVAVAARTPAARGVWQLAPRATAPAALAPTAPPWLARAGPPSSLLQVFQF